MAKSIEETQKEIDEKFKSLLITDKNQLMIISKKSEQLAKLHEEIQSSKKEISLLTQMITNYENEEQIKKERKKLIEENKVLFVPSISSLVLVENDLENEKIIEIYKEKLVKLRESSQNIENVVILTQTSLLRLLEIPKKVETETKASVLEKNISNVSKSHTGHIKWFNHEREFGFIIQDGDLSEVYSNILSLISSL